MRVSLAALATLVGALLACSGASETTAPPPPALAGTGTTDDPHLADCWTTAKDLGRTSGADYVSCPNACTSGMIWGTTRYTPDSKVCVAAIHSGALNAGAAGKVVVTIEGPYRNFTGSAAHGITSQSWSSTSDMSFSVKAAAAPPAGGDEEERAKAGKGAKGGKSGKGR